MLKYPKLLSEIKIGKNTFKNRIFMAPMTRSRSYPNGIIFEMAEEYYAQRSEAGLIISEAAYIDEIAKGYVNTPGIHNAEQVKAWKKITDSVHKSDGKIYIQLMHVGRISHTSLLPEGTLPLSPSGIKANSQTFTEKGLENVSETKEMTLSEIQEAIGHFKKAAEYSKEAGFDGVEIHGANGYLLNQFIATNSNQRSDQYGGNPKNRSRLLIEVIDEVSQVFGSENVGIRLSPTGTFNDIHDTEIYDNYSYIYQEISNRNLAFLDVVERFTIFPVRNEPFELNEKLRPHYNGIYIANGSYTAESAEKIIQENKADAVSFGRLFISNPDLPNRIQNGYELVEPDESTFYGGNEKGYIDYPSYSK